MKFVLFFIFYFFINDGLKAEVGFVPSLDISIYGGKYYIDGESSSMDLKTDIFGSYVINFDEENQLYPIYSGYYNGTQDITELAGGDILTRQRMGHTFYLKYKHSKDFNSIKPRFSYSMNKIKETKDEDWGKGLFDYNVISFGVELEQERPDATYKQYFDFYSVNYPNYASLISKSNTVIDTTTYSELSENAGVNILNSRNYKAGFSYIIFPSNIIITNDFNVVYKDYYDQSVVAKPVMGNPIFKSNNRKDIEFKISSLIENTIKKVYLSIGGDFSWLKSNQNSYDASRTKYIDDYYGYISFSIYPTIRFNFKNAGSFSYSFSYSRINYTGRYSQDIDGNYLNSKINQNYYLSTLNFSYPIFKNVYAKMIYSYQVVNSNMRYEAGYRYNYDSKNVMAGIDISF